MRAQTRKLYPHMHNVPGPPDSASEARGTFTRWQFENALEKSQLPMATCYLLNRIAARADAKTGMIPGQYVPAAESLAAATHMTRRSVVTHLKVAEDAGWVIIERRPGFKSGLALVIPGQPIAPTATQENDAPGCANDAGDLGKSFTGTRADFSHVSDPCSVPAQTKSSSGDEDAANEPTSTRLNPDDDLADMIMKEIKTQHKLDVTPAEARHALAGFLGRPGARRPTSSPAGWAKAVVGREQDIAALLPARPAAARPPIGKCGQCNPVTGITIDENGYPGLPCPRCRPHRPFAVPRPPVGDHYTPDARQLGTMLAGLGMRVPE